ncbi:hypothetical protein BD289DRAFT_110890 [Coniella lustricola]|uniref:C3H1-type domain-containing protein n=1 Tax=Coniella lustricola TaxID=2025994 RepID=A0A2T2ZX90_9PEZI|nr:hypothetical protein BD289DRAFT_110890 [Coniella lustricola]
MYPRPQHFIIRPGCDGQDTLVPLIPTDQLPDWIRLAGAPRALDAEEAVGMTNLGVVAAAVTARDENDDDGDDDGGVVGGGVGCYEASLRQNIVQGLLQGIAEDEEGEEGQQEDLMSSEKGNLGLRSEVVMNEHSSSTCSVKAQTKDAAAIGNSRIVTDQSNGSRSSTTIHNGTTLSQSQKQQHKEDAQNGVMLSPEPTLTASRHNTRTAANEGKTARNDTATATPPHLTEEQQGDGKTSEKPHRSHLPQQVGTNYCRHWCHHGTCKWGLECRFKHRMPTSSAGLREIGLKTLPLWYLLMMTSLGGSTALSGPSQRNESTYAINNGLNAVLTHSERLAQGDETLHHPAQLSSHHRSPADLSLVQGRISALLSGSAAAAAPVSDERMRQSQRKRPGRANLHTNASLAANVADLSAASKRHAERAAGAPVATAVVAELGSKTINRGSASVEGCDELDGRLSPVASDGDGENRSGAGEGQLVDID